MLEQGSREACTQGSDTPSKRVAPPWREHGVAKAAARGGCRKGEIKPLVELVVVRLKANLQGQHLHSLSVQERHTGCYRELFLKADIN